MNSPLNIEPIFVSVPGIFTASACELWFGEQLCKSWRPAQLSTSCPHCKVALELLVLRKPASQESPPMLAGYSSQAAHVIEIIARIVDRMRGAKW